MGKKIMKHYHIIALLTVVVLSAPTATYAGGPMGTVNGNFISYWSSDFPVPYNPDQGKLGTMDNTEATALVEACFNVWADVPTGSITFRKANQLAVDVTDKNYESLLNDYYDGISPIIFDEDGAIVDAEFGKGASDLTLGFAGPIYGTATGQILESYAVINGKAAYDYSFEELKGVFVHEFGHAIGLDHAQINYNYVRDFNTATDKYVPTMIPIATTDLSAMGELNPDDKAVLTLIYPAGTYLSAYGKITGTVEWPGGKPVLGANVVAVQIGDEKMSRFSSVSDVYTENTGEYEMLVTPGTYNLFIEPIEKDFTGGSSVGPYSEDLQQPSFTNAVSSQDYLVPVSVSAGQTASGIDFIAGEDSPPATTTTTSLPATTTSSSSTSTTTTTSGSGSSTTTTASGTTTTTTIAVTTSSTTTVPATTTTTGPAEEIVVDFSANPTSGAAPLGVQFTNKSDKNIASFLWDFGDGTTVTDINPVHYYETAGSYTVSLTAFNSLGKAVGQTEKQDYIAVTGSSCPLASTIRDHESLNALRTLRDGMHTTVWGILLSAIYYQYAQEVTSILSNDAGLRETLRNLIYKNRLQLITAAENKQTRGLATAAQDAVAFLHELRPKAGPSLQNNLTFIIWACENGYLLSSMESGTGESISH